MSKRDKRRKRKRRATMTKLRERADRQDRIIRELCSDVQKLRDRCRWLEQETAALRYLKGEA